MRHLADDRDNRGAQGNDFGLLCGPEKTQLIGGGGSGWGGWKGAVACGTGRVACGIQVRFEDSQGNGDDIITIV